MIHGGEEMERALDDLRGRAEQHSADATKAETALATLTATAESADGAVRATVTASGALSELVLGDAVRRWPPTRTAQQVQLCVQRAQARLADVAAAALADGRDQHPAAEFLVDRLRSGFPPPEPHGSPGPVRGPVDDDEDNTVPAVRPREEW